MDGWASGVGVVPFVGATRPRIGGVAWLVELPCGGVGRMVWPESVEG